MIRGLGNPIVGGFLHLEKGANKKKKKKKSKNGQVGLIILVTKG